jgi:ABC-type Fe3+-hydroxamate transport system substrate-binding protein
MPGILRIFQRCNFVAQVLTDLGINRPRPQNYDHFALDTTLDNTAGANGDVIFVATDEQGAPVFHDQVEPSDPWKALTAVQGGRVREVDDRVWLEGQSYSAAFELLKQLLEFFDDEEMRAKG